MSLTAWVNGRFLPLEEATVHIEDRGFQFADGVYEVIACFGGKFLELDAHLDRLEQSCEAINISLLKSRPELIELIHETYRRNPFDHAMIYIQATRGVAPRSHLLQQEIVPTLVITSRELPTPSANKLAMGASAITLPDIRWQRCDIKSIALLASVIGKQEAARKGVDEAFWLDNEGHILEGCATNCFAVIDGELVTHPLDHQVLGGITRHLTLKIARQHGITVTERPWKLDEPGLTECMMSSTTNAVIAVSHINDKTIGDGTAGPISSNLRQWMIDEFEAMKQ
ncbi:D-alanine transaminase [Mariprofundus aestuarium]|uniref:D-alanine transaminase n=1 Tax=Mariprofundus aestuarium TaxID=1921086 RepID=A0A2K8KYP1_MARES|nr:aminotransferase class IV [Mariprofundus aestuarium]ATX79892.1 D-alanine transaminase [Mariprofundus aestuarium]